MIDESIFFIYFVFLGFFNKKIKPLNFIYFVYFCYLRWGIFRTFLLSKMRYFSGFLWTKICYYLHLFKPREKKFFKTFVCLLKQYSFRIFNYFLIIFHVIFDSPFYFHYLKDRDIIPRKGVSKFMDSFCCIKTRV